VLGRPQIQPGCGHDGTSGVFLQGASPWPPAPCLAVAGHWSGPGPSRLTHGAGPIAAESALGSGTDPGDGIGEWIQEQKGTISSQPIEGASFAAPSRRPPCPGHTRRIWRPWRLSGSNSSSTSRQRAGRKWWLAPLLRPTAGARPSGGEHVRSGKTDRPLPAGAQFPARWPGFAPTPSGAAAESAGSSGLSRRGR